jgi:hypothetical protein
MEKTFPEFKKVITDSRVIMMDGIAINLKQEITMAILRIARQQTITIPFLG